MEKLTANKPHKDDQNGIVNYSGSIVHTEMKAADSGPSHCRGCGQSQVRGARFKAVWGPVVTIPG